jgi:hypothetical protein
VDSYLEIAQRVLRAARRPLSAKGILDAAYSAQIVPDHLQGQTQHKTLQARLSEDILYHRTSSLFYRTEPGYFFLCELMSDPDIPDKFKERFPARRRTRDLQKEQPLGVSRQFLKTLGGASNCQLRQTLLNAEQELALKYFKVTDEIDEYAAVWTFSVVRRKSQVLSYRVGRYRDDRDNFANKKSIALTFSDKSLFSEGDYGASENAISVLLLDLDLSMQSFPGARIPAPALRYGFEAEGVDGVSVFLAVLEWECPDWFEPATRKLSINDPCWLDLDAYQNNIEDFEPWSRAIYKRMANA